jgi:hypothetical protein
MNIIQLKYPPGEFTQAELAAFNGMEKAAVYLPMRAAIDTGILNFSGTRPTGGKRPSNLYQVASNNAPVAVPAPLPPQTIVETPLTLPAPPVVNTVAELVEALESGLQKKSEVMSAPNPAFPCPLCKGPMTELPDATGVMVKCFNEPCDPLCKENVFGHGRNSQDAYKTAKEKFCL